MAQASGVPVVVASAASLHRLFGKQSLPLVLQSASPGEEEHSAVANAASFFGGLCACSGQESTVAGHDSVRLQLLAARTGKAFLAQLHSSSSHRPRLRSMRSPAAGSEAQQGKDGAGPSCSSRHWRAIMLNSPPPTAWQHAQVAVGETMVRDPKTGLRHARLVRAYWDPERHPGKVLLAGLGCDGVACGQLHASARPRWRWQTLGLSANFDTVECVQSHQSKTSEEPVGPFVESVMVLCHEEGSLLALVVGDTDQRSCVIILTANLQPLRHALWCNYDTPALADRKVSIEDGTWLAGTRLLAVVDSYGALGLLDFSGKLVQLELSTLDGEPAGALPQVAYPTLLAMGHGEDPDAPQLPSHCFSVTSCLLPGASSGLSGSWLRQQSGGQAGVSGVGPGRASLGAASISSTPLQISDCKGILAVCDGVSMVLLRYPINPLPPLLLLDTLLVPPAHADTSPSSTSLGAAAPAGAGIVAGAAVVTPGKAAVAVAAAGVGTPRATGDGDVVVGTPTAHRIPSLVLAASVNTSGTPMVSTPAAIRVSTPSGAAASPALLLTMPPSPLAATLASQQLFSPHTLLRQQALSGVSEKACSWPVVHKALTTFGSGLQEEMRIHHAHDPALLRAPSQLSLFEPDPLRSSMGSLAAHSVRSVASTRVSINGAAHPAPALSACSAGPTAYGAADSPGPWTREDDLKGAGAAPVLIDADAYNQLQLGTAALLEGRPSQALAHFVQAHVFGFLPCLLVLLQHLQVMPCITLLRSFVSFIGTCSAAPDPASNGGSNNNNASPTAESAQPADRCRQQHPSSLSPQAVRSRCMLALRSALAALLPGEATDADAFDAMAATSMMERDRTSAPCSVASERESAAGPGPGSHFGRASHQQRPHYIHAQHYSSTEHGDHDRLSAPARTSGAVGRRISGTPSDTLDPGFISLVQQRPTGAGLGSGSTRQGQAGAAGSEAGTVRDQPDGCHPEGKVAAGEVEALLGACKQQLAIGCRCLAFLSHRLHTHATMLQQVAQMQRSPSMTQSPLASPSFNRPSQQRSPYAPRGAPPGVAAVAATAGTPRPSASSPMGAMASRLGRTSIQRYRGATGVEASAQALMVGLPMPVVWHRLPGNSHFPHTDTQGSPMSYAAHVAQPKGNQVSFADSPANPHLQAVQHSTDSPVTSQLCSLGLFHSALDVRRLLPDVAHPTSTYSGTTIPGATSSPALLFGRRVSMQSQEQGQGVEDPLVQLVQQPPAAPAWFLEPQLAAGLLLLAFACDASIELQEQDRAGGREHGAGERGSDPATHTMMTLPRCDSVSLKGTHGPGSPPFRQGSAGGPCSRLNWRLLHAYPPAAQGAALWKGLGDWRKAAVLAFTVHQMIQQRSATGSGAATGPVRPYSLAYVPSQRVSAGRRPSLSGASVADTSPATASCLTIGLSILKEQVARCHGMEVQEACITLHELVAIPRHVLGHHAPVYGLMLRKVCDKLADLLPKRLGITQLLPPATSNPSLLLHFCHHDIRHQLRAQLAQALAKVCGELQLTMGCSGAPMVMCDAVQQVLSDPEVEACMKMLLRWQGCYDAARMASSMQMAFEAAPSSFLFPDAGNGSWEVAKLLNVLELTLSTAGVLLPSDLSSTMQQARKQLPQEGEDDWDGAQPSPSTSQPNVPLGPPPLSSPFGEVAGAGASPVQQQLLAQLAQQHQGAEGPPNRRQTLQQQQLIDLNDLALLVDFAQIAGTLLACIQPHVHVALPILQRELAGQHGNRRASAHSGWLPEAAAAAAVAAAAAEAATAEAGPAPNAESNAAMDELAAAVADLLRQLAALDWAMVCRVNAASLLAQLQTAAGGARGDHALHKIASLDGRRKSVGSALGTRSLSTTQMREHGTTHASPLQLAGLQAQLLAWTSALIDADRYHVDTEMQGAVHMVLSSISEAAVNSHVLDQVNAVEATLRGRNLFNAKLAEQISRLKKAPESGPMQRRGPAASRLEQAQAALEQQQQRQADAAAAVAPPLKTALSMPKGRVHSNGSTPMSTVAAHAAAAGVCGAWQSPDEAADQMHTGLMDALKSFAAAYRGGTTGGSAAASEGNAELSRSGVGATSATSAIASYSAVSPGKGSTARGPLNSAMSAPSRVLRHRSLLCCMLDTLVQQPSHFTGGEAVTDGLGRLLRQDLRDCFVHPLRRWPWHHASNGVMPDQPDAAASSTPAKPGSRQSSNIGAAGGEVKSPSSPVAQGGSWMNAGLETQQELSALLDVSRWLQLPKARHGSKAGSRPPSTMAATAAEAAPAALSAAAAAAAGQQSLAGGGVGELRSATQPSSRIGGTDAELGPGAYHSGVPWAASRALGTGAGTGASQPETSNTQWQSHLDSTEARLAARTAVVARPFEPLQDGGSGVGSTVVAARSSSVTAAAGFAMATAGSSRAGAEAPPRVVQSLDGTIRGRAAGLEDFWYDNADQVSSSGAVVTAGSIVAAAQAATATNASAGGAKGSSSSGGVGVADLAVSIDRLASEEAHTGHQTARAHSISRNLARPLTVDVPGNPPSGTLPKFGAAATGIQFVRVALPVQAITPQAVGGASTAGALNMLASASSEGLPALQQQPTAMVRSGSARARVSADNPWLHPSVSLTDTVAATVAAADDAPVQSGQNGLATGSCEGVHAAAGSLDGLRAGSIGHRLSTDSTTSAPFRGPLEAWTAHALSHEPPQDPQSMLAAQVPGSGIPPAATNAVAVAAAPVHSVSGGLVSAWLRSDCDASEAATATDLERESVPGSEAVSEQASEAMATVSAALRSALSAAASAGRPPSGAGLESVADPAAPLSGYGGAALYTHPYPTHFSPPDAKAAPVGPMTSAWSAQTGAPGSTSGASRGPSAYSSPVKGSSPQAAVSLISTSPLVAEFLRGGDSQSSSPSPTKSTTTNSNTNTSGMAATKTTAGVHQHHHQTTYASLHASHPPRPATAVTRATGTVQQSGARAVIGLDGGASSRAAAKPPVVPHAANAGGAAQGTKSGSAGATTKNGGSSVRNPTASSAAKSAVNAKTSGSANVHNPLFNRQFRS